MSIKAKLLSDCETFIEESGIGATDFGRAACAYPNLMTRLRRGDGITVDKADEVYAYMKKWRCNAQRRAKYAEKRKAHE